MDISSRHGPFYGPWRLTQSEADTMDALAADAFATYAELGAKIGKSCDSVEARMYNVFKKMREHGVKLEAAPRRRRQQVTLAWLAFKKSQEQ